jgi:hypothetical protein
MYRIKVDIYFCSYQKNTTLLHEPILLNKGTARSAQKECSWFIRKEGWKHIPQKSVRVRETKQPTLLRNDFQLLQHKNITFQQQIKTKDDKTTSLQREIQELQLKTNNLEQQVREKDSKINVLENEQHGHHRRLFNKLRC